MVLEKTKNNNSKFVEHFFLLRCLVTHLTDLLDSWCSTLELWCDLKVERGLDELVYINELFKK